MWAYSALGRVSGETMRRRRCGVGVGAEEMEMGAVLGLLGHVAFWLLRRGVYRLFVLIPGSRCVEVSVKTERFPLGLAKLARNPSARKRQVPSTRPRLEAPCPRVSDKVYTSMRSDL